MSVAKESLHRLALDERESKERGERGPEAGRIDRMKYLTRGGGSASFAPSDSFAKALTQINPDPFRQLTERR